MGLINTVFVIVLLIAAAYAAAGSVDRTSAERDILNLEGRVYDLERRVDKIEGR